MVTLKRRFKEWGETVQSFRVNLLPELASTGIALVFLGWGIFRVLNTNTIVDGVLLIVAALLALLNKKAKEHG